MVDPFEEYRQVRSALKPLVIPVSDEVEVELPGAPTLQWRLDFLTLTALNPEVPREEIMFTILPDLFPTPEKAEEVVGTLGYFLSEPEMFALLRGVVKHYELTEEDTANPRIAPKIPTSEDLSSASSEPSKQTSNASTAG